MKSRACVVGISSLTVILFGGSLITDAQEGTVVLTRGLSTVVLEPYAKNIIRITLSKVKDKALAPPGYGFIASPVSDGWKKAAGTEDDVYSSDRLVVKIDADRPPQLSENDRQLAQFFDFFNEPRAHITVSTPDGKILVDMLSWSMRKPGDADGNSEILYNQRPTDEPFYRVGATFASPPDEH